MKRFLNSVTILSAAVLSWAGHASEGDLSWALALGGDGWSIGNEVAADGDGGIVVVGTLNGTVDFDPGDGVFNLTSVGENDVFVQKLNADGSLAWARSVGGIEDDSGAGLAIDAGGAVHVTGSFRGTVDFDPGDGVFELTSLGERDAYILKLDTDGNFAWVRRMGGGQVDMGNAIAVDAAGGVYSTGIFSGGVDLNPGAGAFNLFSLAGQDIYIQKLDSAGNFVWARQLRGSISEDVHGIAVDSEGNVLVSGRFVGQVDFDPGAGEFEMESIGLLDSFVLKLNADADFAWARSMGGIGEARVGNSDLAVDALGAVYSAGFFQGTVDLDPGAETLNLTSRGFPDFYVHKVDADGNFEWAKQVSGSSTQVVTGIALDNAANVITTGHYYGNVDFDPGAGDFVLNGIVGVSSGFVQKLDSQGSFVWAKGFSGADCFGGGVAVGPGGDVFATGYFVGTVDFDPGIETIELTSNEDGAAFALKLAGPQDTTAPNVVSIVPESVGPTNADTITFGVAFDEAVQNFDDAADLVVAHAGTAHGGITIDGGPSEYSVAVTGISGVGSFTLAVSTSSDIEDRAGNALASSPASAAVSIIDEFIEGEGSVEGSIEGAVEGVVEGVTEGSFEGLNEGEVEGASEGIVEGAVEGESEGEGDGEGALEGEGETEGEDLPTTGCNALNGDGGCNAWGASPSFEEILGQLFMGALTVMALALMALYQKRFW